MFLTGQRVVCIDDQFPEWVFQFYRELPVRGGVYTVRALRPGKTNPQFGVTTDHRVMVLGGDPEILVLLEEIRNDLDPFTDPPQELGFRADRFEPLRETQTPNQETWHHVGIA